MDPRPAPFLGRRRLCGRIRLGRWNIVLRGRIHILVLSHLRRRYIGFCREGFKSRGPGPAVLTRVCNLRGRFFDFARGQRRDGRRRQGRVNSITQGTVDVVIPVL